MLYRNRPAAQPGAAAAIINGERWLGLRCAAEDHVMRTGRFWHSTNRIARGQLHHKADIAQGSFVRSHLDLFDQNRLKQKMSMCRSRAASLAPLRCGELEYCANLLDHQSSAEYHLVFLADPRSFQDSAVVSQPIINQFWR
jgi:hypothetical protein